MIFISVGHHKDKPGASFDGFNEYDEAQRWAAAICRYLGDACILVPVGFLRNKVNHINNRDPSRSVAVEIHFNSARNDAGEPIGKGCETLYYPGSEKGIVLAEIVNDALAHHFSPNRGIKEGYYRMDKAYGVDYFLARTKCPAIIIEPDFIHRKDIIQNNREDACFSVASSLVTAHSKIYG